MRLYTDNFSRQKIHTQAFVPGMLRRMVHVDNILASAYQQSSC